MGLSGNLAKVDPAKGPKFVVHVSGCKSYLYADDAGDKPVQYAVWLECTSDAYENKDEWRYRKRSWPSGHWCTFDQKERVGWFPVRRGGELVVQVRDISRRSDWSEPAYVSVSEQGEFSVRYGGDPMPDTSEQDWGEVKLKEAKKGAARAIDESRLVYVERMVGKMADRLRLLEENLSAHAQGRDIVRVTTPQPEHTSWAEVQRKAGGAVKDKSWAEVQRKAGGAVKDKSWAEVQRKAGGAVKDKSWAEVQRKAGGAVKDKFVARPKEAPEEAAKGGYCIGTADGHCCLMDRPDMCDMLKKKQ